MKARIVMKFFHNTPMLHRELLIGGHFFGGPCDQSVGKSASKNPWTGLSVGTTAEAGWSEAKAAVEAANDAFKAWRFSSRSDRSDLLLAIAAQIQKREDELADLLMQEVGKPITLARGEVMRMRLTFELAARAAKDFGRETIDVSYDPRAAGHIVTSDRFPIGPILAITPYNWPFNLAAHKLAPAIATGNTVILKGSESATLCTLTLGQLIHEAGCPAGVVNALNADARTTERMADLDMVKMISFTGSPKVGWHIKRKYPEKRIVLELGGNAMAAVFPDADLDLALSKLASSAFGYAGQVCISVQHVLVHAARYEEACDLLCRLTTSFPTGDPGSPDVLCGPLISEAATDRVEQMIREAVAAGAKVLAGGTRSKNVITPTLLSNVPTQAQLYSEEVFGPVVTIEPFESVEDVISRVNNSQYGIHASVFTSESETVKGLYRELDVGGLIVNEPPTLRFDAMPYGGVKRSGIGREGVLYAMQEMTEPKAMVRKTS